MRRTLILIAALLAPASLVPATADAKWFPAERVDGPGPIAAMGGVSLARDGSGGVVYVKQEGDNPVGYLARFTDGAWAAPERLPADGVGEIRVAAGDRGRLAIAWTSGAGVFGAVVGGEGAAVSAPVRLSMTGGASGLDVQAGVRGAAFAVWAEPGAGGSDVRAAQLAGSTWTAIAPVLDIDVLRPAGAGAARPRVAVAADDTAVVAWGETPADGRPRVYYRRLLETTLSQYPQEASVAALGSEAGGTADTPQIDVEYDRSFAWVAFRQDLGGRSRTLMRRLRGSTFDAPVVLDGGATSQGAALGMSMIGEGVAVTAGADNSLLASTFEDDVVHAPERLDATVSTGPPTPVAAFDERGDGAAAYRTQSAAGATVRGRLVLLGRAAGAEAILSDGPVVAGSLHMGGDRVGDFAVAMLEGAPGARELTVALQDIPPGRPAISARSRYVNPITEGITWAPGLDFLGPQRFRVRVDGRTVGTTSRARLRTRRVRQGRHKLQIVAFDRRGQRTSSRTTLMFVDTGRPRASVSASRSGRVVTVTVQASDPGRHATGVRQYGVDWGDGRSSTSSRGRLRHRYESGGRPRITVTVRDRARNETVRRLRP
jgi:hypothetical protein